MSPEKKHEPVTMELFSGKLGTPNLEKKLGELSEAIECVSVAAKKFDQSNLTREVLVILIQHAAHKANPKLVLDQVQVNAVLDAMLGLGGACLKVTPGEVIDLKGGPLTADMLMDAAKMGAKLGGQVPEMPPVYPEIAKYLKKKG